MDSHVTQLLSIEPMHEATELQLMHGENQV